MHKTLNPLTTRILAGDRRALARAITTVENQLEGYEELLVSLPVNRNIPVTGITGPPGAGKSTLISALLKTLLLALTLMASRTKLRWLRWIQPLRLRMDHY
jgi:putative protein kinase ArgK-like GTPase of G3E family